MVSNLKNTSVVRHIERGLRMSVSLWGLSQLVLNAE